MSDDITFNKKEWNKYILEKVPHGEDGHIELEIEDAIALQKILLRNGYAVLITSGDTGDDYCVSWIYAGNPKCLNYADVNNICFTSIDYIREYPYAFNECKTETEQNQEN